MKKFVLRKFAKKFRKIVAVWAILSLIFGSCGLRGAFGVFGVFSAGRAEAADPIFKTFADLYNSNATLKLGEEDPGGEIGRSWHVLKQKNGAYMLLNQETTGVGSYDEMWQIARNYAAQVLDETLINDLDASTNFLTEDEYDNNYRLGKISVSYDTGSWWLRDGEQFVNYKGEKKSGRDDVAAYRPAMYIDNLSKVYFFSGSAKNPTYKGTLVTEDSVGEGYRLTLKDNNATVTLGGGALLLDAKGTSTWCATTTLDKANRISALTWTNADSKAASATGYMYMGEPGKEGGIILGKKGSKLSGTQTLHIVGERKNDDYYYEIMTYDDYTLSGLTYDSNGYLTAMTLSHNTSSNDVTLQNGFTLSLGNTTYNQTFTISGNDGYPTLIADSSGSTIAGKLTVNTIFTLSGNLTLAGKQSHAIRANIQKPTSGSSSLTVASDATFNMQNNGTVNQMEFDTFTANASNAKVKMDMRISDSGVISDIIKATTVNIGSNFDVATDLAISIYSDFTGQKSYTKKLFDATTVNGNILINGSTTGVLKIAKTAGHKAYKITASSTPGAIDIKMGGITLRQIVQGKGDVSDFGDIFVTSTTLDGDYTLTDATDPDADDHDAGVDSALGTLSLENGRSELTIDGGTNKYKIIAGGFGGAVIPNGGTITFQKLTMQGFATAITVNDGGTANLSGVTFSGTTSKDVTNNNTLNINGTVTFSKGVDGTGTTNFTNDNTIDSGIGISQATVTVASGKLTNKGTITATGGFTNSGTVDNYGAINANITNSGTFNSYISLDAGNSVTGTGTFNFMGTANLTNNATITQTTVTNAANLTNNNTITATNLTNTGTLTSEVTKLAISDKITNDSTLNLSAATDNDTFNAEVARNSGVGTLNFNGNKKIVATKKISQNYVNINTDLDMQNELKAISAITVAEGKNLTIAAGHLTSGIVVISGANLGNQGIVTLTDGDGTLGALGVKIAGTGKIVIAGAITTNAANLASDTNEVSATNSLTLIGSDNAGKLSKAITNNATVTAKTGVTIDSTITNNGTSATTTLESGASFGENGKISGGDVVLGEGVKFNKSNLDNVATLDLQGAIYDNFGANVGVDGANPSVDKIVVTGVATGTIKLGSVNITGTNTYSDWKIGDAKEVQYLTSGAGSTLQIDTAGSTTATSDGYKYTFAQGTGVGYMSIKKDNGYDLSDIVQNNTVGGYQAGKVDAYALLTDYTETANLGELKRPGSSARTLTIYGNNHKFAGGSKTGITINNGDTLNVYDVKEISGWASSIAFTNAGNLNFDNYSETNALELKNGITNTGTVTFDQDVNLTGTLSGAGSYINKESKTMTVADASKLGSNTTITNNGTLDLGDGATADTTLNAKLTYTTSTTGDATVNFNGSKKITATGAIAQKAVYVNTNLDMQNALTADTVYINDNANMTDILSATETILADGSNLTIGATNLKSNVKAEGDDKNGTVKLNAGTLGNYTITDGAIVIAGAVEANADNLKSNKGIANANTLTLNGGDIKDNISGTGNTIISGAVTNTSGKTITQGALTINTSLQTNVAELVISGVITNNGMLELTGGTVSKAITNTGTVKLAGAQLGGAHVTAGTLEFAQNITTNAGYVAANTNTVDNDVTLTLNDGTLSKAVEGAGTVKFTGGELAADVTSNTLEFDGTVEANASNIKGTTNKVTSGTLTLTSGTLANAMTNSSNITVGNGVVINNTITNASATTTFNTGSSFGASGKVSGGAVVFGKDVEFSAANLDANGNGIESLTAPSTSGENAKFKLKIDLNNGDPNLDQIKLTGGKATGNIVIDKADISGYSTYDEWAIGAVKQLDYIQGHDTANSNITITDTYEVVYTDSASPDSGYMYRFMQGHATQGDDTSDPVIGKIDIGKYNGFSLFQIVKDEHDDTTNFYAGHVKAFALSADYHEEKDLKAMLHDGTTGERALSIYGNGNIFNGTDATGATGAHEGIRIAKGKTDKLTLDNIKVSGWAENVLENNSVNGTINLNNVTFSGTQANYHDVVNDGTLNITESVKFDKGVVCSESGDIEGIKGTLNIDSGAVVDFNNTDLKQKVVNVKGAGTKNIKDLTVQEITGEDKDSSKLTVATLHSTQGQDITASNVTLNVTGNDASLEGNFVLNNALFAGAGADKTMVTAKAITSNSSAEIKNVTFKLSDTGTSAVTETLSATDATFVGNSADPTVLKAKNFNFEGNVGLYNLTLDATPTNNAQTNVLMANNMFKALSFGNTTNELNPGEIYVGDSLTLYGQVATKGKIVSSGSLLFNLDDDPEQGIEKRNGYTFLTTDTPMDLSTLSAEPVALIQTNKKYDKLKKGETMTLVTNVVKDSYLGKKRVKTSGGLRKFVYSVAIEEVPNEINVTEERTMSLLTSPLLGAGEDNKKYALILGYLAQEATPQTKSFTQSKFALTAAINDAGDLIATNLMDSVMPKGKDWEAFAVMKGSNSRYDEVSSNVTLNMFNVAAGLSKVVLDNLTLGVFAEGGNGRYDTSHNFVEDEVANGVSSKGDINYFGGGLFAKWEGKETQKGQFHSEVSMRAGHINSKYNSNNFDPEIPYLSFDLSGSYIGAHAGFGYKWLLKSGNKIDTYVKYLWSRQCTTNRTIIEDELTSLDGINSHRARIGFRYYGKEDENGLTVFGGLAYEHEFDGQAKGYFTEYSLPEPDMKGGSGMAELGVKVQKGNSPWRGELAVQGHAGSKRDSIGVNLGLWYEIPHKKEKIEQAQEKFEEKNHEDFEQKINNSELKQEKLEQEIKKIGYKTEK